jgi:hypothetical protein
LTLEDDMDEKQNEVKRVFDAPVPPLRMRTTESEFCRMVVARSSACFVCRVFLAGTTLARGRAGDSEHRCPRCNSEAAVPVERARAEKWLEVTP